MLDDGHSVVVGTGPLQFYKHEECILQCSESARSYQHCKLLSFITLSLTKQSNSSSQNTIDRSNSNSKTSLNLFFPPNTVLQFAAAYGYLWVHPLSMVCAISSQAA